MKDKALQSGLAMVRIDGSLVRQLREEKGLTQLYIATSVGVTTDTISRWENRHYQSIKMENAQGLAAALEVEFEDILETEDENAPMPPTRLEENPPSSGTSKRQTALHILLSGIISVVLVFIWYSRPKEPIPEIILSATRNTPSQAMPGYPFPVVITVETRSSPLSLVIKESLPANIRVTSSATTLQPMDKAELKWIVKHMTGQQRFGYMVTAADKETLHFQGSVNARAGHGKEVVIGGIQSLALTPFFHWADSNQDGIISDDEILVVYDDFDDVSGLTVDVELVEEMWMGSGYKWNQEKSFFEVIP